MPPSSTHWDKIRPQFDTLPYPNLPLDDSPKDTPDYLAKHSSVIPHYLRTHRVIETQDKWILDAGCGSGYKLLALAIANPGANIVGVDISPKSLELAQKRLEYHQISNPSYFHCLPIEELPSLPYRFDYINCDDVLYLLEDPVVGLQAMKAVLNPDGIIRANMHSILQRRRLYRVQEFLTRLGCLEGAPTPDEIAVTRQMMATLQDWVISKKYTWNPRYETDDQMVLMNLLFRGDTGITMADFSAMLKKAGLEFIKMVSWRAWELEKLFTTLEELPKKVAIGLADMSAEQRLHLFELLHPVHRLLDLYCGRPSQGNERSPLTEWDESIWQQATVYIHPQLNTPAFKERLEDGADNLGVIPLHHYLKLDNPEIGVDSAFSGCLYALLDGPKAFPDLVKRWLQVRPLNLITQEPTKPKKAFQTVRDFLVSLEQSGYVLVEVPQG